MGGSGSGGYHPPAKPAAVSGPGKYSRRTDGQSISVAPGQDYGDAKAQIAAQQAAPMGATAPTPGAPQGAAPAPQRMPAYQGGDFTGPSQRPGVPITHGVDIGPGAGSGALNLPTPPSNGGPAPTGAMTNLLHGLAATDTTGLLAQLYQTAAARGV